RLGDVRERAPAEQQGDDKCERAEGADPAVAHDLELVLAGLAAESVEGIGKPVLVHRAGQRHRRRERQRRCRDRRHIEADGEPVGQRAAEADQDSRDRKSPAGARHGALVELPGRANRETCAKRDRDPQVRNQVAQRLDILGHRYFTRIGKPATTNSTSSAACAIIWFIVPAASRNWRASALSGTIPSPTSLVTSTT